MNIQKLIDSQIADNIRRYRERGVITGGFFSLAELLSEQHRRKRAGVLPTKETAQAIIELARDNSDGLTTYVDLRNRLRPDTPWSVFPSRGEVTNALERVQHYCLRHDLPLLATLVVNKSERHLTPAARANIAAWAADHGMAVGLDGDAFVYAQQEAARQVTTAGLPDD